MGNGSLIIRRNVMISANKAAIDNSMSRQQYTSIRWLKIEIIDMNATKYTRNLINTRSLHIFVTSIIHYVSWNLDWNEICIIVEWFNYEF